jgi:hypothetical protein
MVVAPPYVENRHCRNNPYNQNRENPLAIPVSSGTVMHTMDSLSDQVPPQSMKAEWTELTLLRILAGNTAIYAFVGFTSFLYDSWSQPLAVPLKRSK